MLLFPFAWLKASIGNVAVFALPGELIAEFPATATTFYFRIPKGDRTTPGGEKLQKKLEAEKDAHEKQLRAEERTRIQELETLQNQCKITIGQEHYRTLQSLLEKPIRKDKLRLAALLS